MKEIIRSGFRGMGWIAFCCQFAGVQGFGEEKPEAPVEPAKVEVPVKMADEIDFGPTPMSSIPEGHAKSFRIPAPRGMIVSREGEPLAINEVKHRLTLRLPAIGKNAAEVELALQEMKANFNLPWLSISAPEITRHLEHRPWIPLAVSGTLSDEEVSALPEPLPRGLALEAIYVRSYPEKELTAHLIGYIGDSLPDQHGPIGKVEYLWPPLVGRAGMEKSLDAALQGEDGEVERLYDAEGNLIHQEIARPARPGETMVLSINLAMQRRAEKALARTGRPGAFVAVDADTGDILAMVSYPSFDPNLFTGGIPTSTYRELADREDAPFFDRAVQGEYPPGSTFKPFVALAGMEWGKIDNLNTKFTGPSVVLIDGRPFKNWSNTSEGSMDLRYALMRSCNTWFYQAAMQMGPYAMADVSRRFGLGAAPVLPLPAVASGHIPEPGVYGDMKSLANFSIGQGRVLASPVQMALAMAALANRTHVPKPRLIMETLDPLSGELVARTKSEVASPLYLDPEQVELVQEGMWGVVNHRLGTAGGASLSKPVVYGKTGTSEWAEDSQKRSLAWFTGWVDAEKPRIAFAAVTHGRRREALSGGRSAAPIAADVLRDAYRDPDLYAVTLPEGPARPNPRLTLPLPVVVEVIPEENNRTQQPFGGLFKRLFGQRRSQPAEMEPNRVTPTYIMELSAP